MVLWVSYHCFTSKKVLFGLRIADCCLISHVFLIAHFIDLILAWRDISWIFMIFPLQLQMSISRCCIEPKEGAHAKYSKKKSPSLDKSGETAVRQAQRVNPGWRLFLYWYWTCILNIYIYMYIYIYICIYTVYTCTYVYCRVTLRR